MSERRQISLEVDDTTYRLLEVLTKGQHATAVSVDDVVHQLIDHAQQGVYRPGSWERGWIGQAFGFEWIAHLEPGDPHGRVGAERFFQKPRA